ncbi:carbon-nitrogen hydrolase [Dactylonectria macrodidyma]|uniref:Carbon-nitrogen hydrolase n=1 Tax=Dactylonectria macrodidyma TaxID=307937 RepID=A0A9P9FFT7_9HYPO|nr:carbon-nitrogen hydrolase [Dactylonectria macrodidyma]
MAAIAMNHSFRVAIIQMRPKPLDAEHNFSHAAEQIRLAASQGASLAVLPEYHLTDWVPKEPSFALTSENARRFLQQYQDLARELGINICTGTIVTQAPRTVTIQVSKGSTEASGPALLNTSHFIDYNGRILGSYTKTNLWIPERQHLTSSVDYARQTTTLSNPHQVINTPLGPVGILVCWDLAFPEAFRQLVLAGAKIIIIPSYWTSADMCKEGLAYNPNCEEMFVQSTLITRAFENTAAVIYCNAGGSAEEGFFGCSQVVLPIVGKVPGSFTDGEEEMRVLEVDMQAVELAERNYEIRRDLARENWHYGYAKSRDGTRLSSNL